MDKKLIDSVFAVAFIHAQRITYALEHLKTSMPFSEEDILHLTDEQMLLIELYINRFSKLQDLMGTKLFGLLLYAAGEGGEELTLIDKINKLEKLNVLDSASDWVKLRETRNHLTHEYPNRPDLTALHLNTAYGMGPLLLSYLSNLSTFYEGLKKSLANKSDH